MSAWTQEQVRRALRQRRSSIAGGTYYDQEELQHCRTAWTALCALADSYCAGDIGLIIHPGAGTLQASWQPMEGIRVAVNTLTSHPEHIYRRLAVPPADNELRFVVFLCQRSGVVDVRLRELPTLAGALVAPRGFA